MLNKFMAMGRLTADPEMRTTPKGISVCHFTIAVDRSFKKGEEKQTDFFNCVAFEGRAEHISKYFAKGQAAVVVGRVQNRSWVDDKGNKRYATDIIVEEIHFTGSKKENSETQPKEEVNDSEPEFTPSLDDFLPF